MLAPANQWDDSASGEEPRRQLIHRAKLLAADTSVLNPGGGNFSVKERVADHLGRATDVLWISGWGCDGALLTEDDLACLRVADVRHARGGSLTSESMFGYLGRCATTTRQPYPAIETLIHAYLRAPHVDHTHPEAVIALTAVDSGRALASQTFGDEAIWVDYAQFSPAFADDVTARIAARPQARFVLLANHGLLTWGGTSKQCYGNTIEAATRAADALRAARRRPPDLGGAAVPPMSRDEAESYLADVLPAIRGQLSTAGTRMVLLTDSDPSARFFSCSKRGPSLSRIGPACPDSLVKMKRVPAVVQPPQAGDARQRRLGVTIAIAAYRDDYLGYWRRNAPASEPVPPAGAGLPRVFVIRGAGVVSAGEDAFAASLAEAHYRQTRRVVTAADSVGGYSSLSEAQAYRDEYWPLLRGKPSLRPPRGELAGHVVLVVPDGADGQAPAGELVERLAYSLVSAGAHVVVAARPGASAADLPQESCAAGAAGQAATARLRTCPARDPVRGATLAFGGIDFVVHLQATEQSAARLAAAAAEVFGQQGWCGHYIATLGPARRASGVLCALQEHVRRGVVPHVLATDPGFGSAAQEASALRGIVALAQAGLSAGGLLRTTAGAVAPAGAAS